MYSCHTDVCNYTEHLTQVSFEARVCSNLHNIWIFNWKTQLTYSLYLLVSI